eukprot:129800-Amphidinium_carterae.1
MHIANIHRVLHFPTPNLQVKKIQSCNQATDMQEITQFKPQLVQKLQGFGLDVIVGGSCSAFQVYGGKFGTWE